MWARPHSSTSSHQSTAACATQIERSSCQPADDLLLNSNSTNRKRRRPLGLSNRSSTSADWRLASFRICLHGPQCRINAGTRFRGFEALTSGCLALPFLIRMNVNRLWPFGDVLSSSESRSPKSERFSSHSSYVFSQKDQDEYFTTRSPFSCFVICCMNATSTLAAQLHAVLQPS